MKQLTEYQIDFILYHFFPTYDYPNAREIGKKLLTNGFCIVAGKSQIHFAPISQFIYAEKADEFIDCLKYTLDLEKFLNSQLFKSVVENQKRKYESKKIKLKEEFKKNLINLNREYEDICKF